MSDEGESNFPADGASSADDGAADLGDTVDRRLRLPDDAHSISEVESTVGSIELFDDLTASEVREVVEICHAQSLAAGTQLFRQGDDADALYIVESGELQVRAQSPAGEDVVLAVLGAGAVVGEMSLIGGQARSASVEVISDAQVIELGRSAFDELRSARRMAAYKIIVRLARILGDRRRRADARVNQVFADPDQHLENFESQLNDMLGRLKKA